MLPFPASGEFGLTEVIGQGWGLLSDDSLEKNDGAHSRGVRAVFRTKVRGQGAAEELRAS
jgi:hypothetical protein